eukprot:TRINITY_DN4372_c1_g1_i2.p3 TRINITY_DN4372_c1_g1~~TRINITY_DN4372_c1_g1_i2.p3  ORF type:complete len:186 (+),score=-23.65 TRINITY_DN4372_c1_g1_i2:587-1144(+)
MVINILGCQKQFSNLQNQKYLTRKQHQLFSTNNFNIQKKYIYIYIPTTKYFLDIYIYIQTSVYIFSSRKINQNLCNLMQPFNKVIKIKTNKKMHYLIQLQNQYINALCCKQTICLCLIKLMALNSINIHYFLMTKILQLISVELNYVQANSTNKPMKIQQEYLYAKKCINCSTVQYDIFYNSICV